MLAAFAAAANAEDPLRVLQVAEIEPPAVPDGWVRVEVKAAALNHHDVWSLRGVGLPADRLPMILGCDAAGVAPDGREVIVYAVVNDPGFTGTDATYDPRRSLLSERYPGTFAGTVGVPAANLIDKPAELSFAEAACLPTAWLTAYRMLFTASGVRPGDTVLVQGAGGGVATALVVLGGHAGLRVWVTSRDEQRAARAVALGADQSFASGARLPERVDAVMDTVGAATWSHSVNALRPGGTLVISGTTSGADPAEGRADQDLLQAAPGDRLHHGHAGRVDVARPDARRDRSPAGDRPVAAPGRGPGRLRGHDRRRCLRQDHLRTVIIRGT